MWVADDWRGAGLGSRMLRELEALAARLGHTRIVLDTNGTLLEAIAMYGREGYAEIARYNDNPYAERWFEKALTSDRRGRRARGGPRSGRCRGAGAIGVELVERWVRSAVSPVISRMQVPAHRAGPVIGPRKSRTPQFDGPEARRRPAPRARCRPTLRRSRGRWPSTAGVRWVRGPRPRRCLGVGELGGGLGDPAAAPGGDLEGLRHAPRVREPVGGRARRHAGGGEGGADAGRAGRGDRPAAPR